LKFSKKTILKKWLGNSSLLPPTFFIRKIFRMKLQIDQENSDYFMGLGTIALSDY
jgi:hypothetical protein